MRVKKVFGHSGHWDISAGVRTEYLRKGRKQTHCVWFGVAVSLHHVKSQTFLAHKLLGTDGTLQKHVSATPCEELDQHGWSGVGRLGVGPCVGAEVQTLWGISPV